MTYKMIVLSDHVASKKLPETGITRGEIRWLVRNGAPYAPDTLVSGHRYARRGFIRQRLAEVIYIEDAHQILIRTIMWVYKENR